MKITFLIGNGFDIGVGLLSRFVDFFPLYQVMSREKPDRIRMLSEAIGADYKTWADFEGALGKYTEKFTPETKKFFLDQIKDFESDFIEFLKKLEANVGYKDETLIKNTIEKAITGYFSTQNLPFVSSRSITSVYTNHRTETPEFNFINFNYTDVLQKCINITQKLKDKNLNYKLGSVINVHGKCDSYPVFGVNDTSQIKNKELANDTLFASRIVKPTINELIGNNNDVEAYGVIKNSKIIVVYGMSIGETDNLWWDRILEWLCLDAERQLVIFDYDEEFKTTTPFDKLDKDEYYYNKLSKCIKGKNIKIDTLKNKIHIAVHKNIFEMDLMKERDELFKKALEMSREKKLIESE